MKFGCWTVSATRELTTTNPADALRSSSWGGYIVVESSIVPGRRRKPSGARARAWDRGALVGRHHTTAWNPGTGPRRHAGAGRDAVRESAMEAFGVLFLVVSFRKIGTSESRRGRPLGVDNGESICGMAGIARPLQERGTRSWCTSSYRYRPCNCERSFHVREHLSRGEGARQQPVSDLYPSLSFTLPRSRTIRSADEEAEHIRVGSGAAARWPPIALRIVLSRSAALLGERPLRRARRNQRKMLRQ